MHVSIHTKVSLQMQADSAHEDTGSGDASIEKDRHRSFTVASLYAHIMAHWVNVSATLYIHYHWIPVKQGMLFLVTDK